MITLLASGGSEQCCTVIRDGGTCPTVEAWRGPFGRQGGNPKLRGEQPARHSTFSPAPTGFAVLGHSGRDPGPATYSAERHTPGKFAVSAKP